MALELISVSHRYGRRPALTEVNLRVEPGDCYGFIGHNGAGKSTAMRIALGLIKPGRGRVVVDGFDARSSPLEVRARMGGLIETPGFFDHLGGHRNLMMLARLQGLSSAAARQEADRLLETVGLDDVPTLPVGSYSQGMRQRLGIAQAMIGNPRYILLDEPGNGLDPEGLAEMRRLIRRLTRDEGVTVLISSHQLHEIGAICNRIGVLKKGRLLVEDEAGKLLLGDGKLLVESTERERAKACLLAEGCGVEDEPEGLLVDPGGRPAAALSRALIAADVPLDAIGPRSASLEDIYLALESEGAAPAPRGDGDAADRPPASEKLAPGQSFLRGLRWETQRLLSRPLYLLLFLLPLLIGWYEIYSRHREALELEEKVASGEIMTTTKVTAFEGVAFGLSTSLLLAAVILCGYASQSLAGELDRGTLRNVFLRPIRRGTVVLSKFVAFGMFSFTVYAALMTFVVLVAGHYFPFEGVEEVLPNGETMSVLDVDVLWGALKVLACDGIIPFLSFTALGFMAGALVRSGVAALMLSLGGLFLFDFGRTISREFDLDSWMPPAHMPSKLGDTSFLLHYEHTVTNVSNASETLDVTHLLPWLGLSLLISLVLVTRRDLR